MHTDECRVCNVTKVERCLTWDCSNIVVDPKSACRSWLMSSGNFYTPEFSVIELLTMALMIPLPKRP
jgi:hypothetical protein